MKKIFKGIILSLAVSCLLSGCNKKNPAGKKFYEVRMAGNPFIGNAPLYVAWDKGFFTEEGINFSIVDFEDSSFSCTALISSNVELAGSTLDAVVIAESQYDSNTLKVFSASDESYGADGIIARNSISTLADLKGKTVGVAVNQTTHYLLQKALDKVGLSDKDLNLVNMSSSDAGASFITGNLDAAVTWEPYLSNAVTSGTGKILFSSADAPGVIVDVIVMRAEDKEASWLKPFSKAFDRAVDYIFAEKTKDDAMQLIAKHLEVSPKEAEEMLGTVKIYKTSMRGETLSAGGIVNKAVGDISDFYLSRNIIKRQVAPSELCD